MKYKFLFAISNVILALVLTVFAVTVKEAVLPTLEICP